MAAVVEGVEVGEMATVFDWTQYRGNLDWLPERTIYVTRHGSHAYGTSLPTSDLDLRGICVAPREYYLGFLKTVEQADQHEPDLSIFELRKFMKLASEANPNVLELLFTDESDRLLTTPTMDRLFAAREMFLSTKAKHTFSGYAVSQLKRINIHQRWLKNPPAAPPTRADFGLPERTVIPADQLAAANAAVRKQVEEWTWHSLDTVEPATRQAIQDDFARRLAEITGWAWTDVEVKTWTAAAQSIGYDANFIRLLDLERQYQSRLKEWQHYQEWKKTRNPARAVLEERFGYDTKHGMHLVRLLRMCREILTTGEVLVRRPDAEELLEIRAGAWSYERIVEWAERQDAELTELAKASTLPKQVDRVALDALCVSIVESML